MIGVRAAGMVTAVGLDWASSAAAIRARLDGFAETRFVAAGTALLAIGDMSDGRLVAGGKRGTVFIQDGDGWQSLEMSTNVRLTAVGRMQGATLSTVSAAPVIDWTST